MYENCQQIWNIRFFYNSIYNPSQNIRRNKIKWKWNCHLLRHHQQHQTVDHQPAAETLSAEQENLFQETLWHMQLLQTNCYQNVHTEKEKHSMTRVSVQVAENSSLRHAKLSGTLWRTWRTKGRRRTTNLEKTLALSLGILKRSRLAKSNTETLGISWTRKTSEWKTRSDTINDETKNASNISLMKWHVLVQPWRMSGKNWDGP